MSYCSECGNKIKVKQYGYAHIDFCSNVCQKEWLYRRAKNTMNNEQREFMEFTENIRLANSG